MPDQEKELSVVVPAEMEEPVRVNTFRVGITEGAFAFEFGCTEEDEVHVKSSVQMGPKLTLQFLKTLLTAMKGYEDDFGHDFGIFEKRVAATSESEDVQDQESFALPL